MTTYINEKGEPCEQPKPGDAVSVRCISMKFRNVFGMKVLVERDAATTAISKTTKLEMAEEAAVQSSTGTVIAIGDEVPAGKLEVGDRVIIQGFAVMQLPPTVGKGNIYSCRYPDEICVSVEETMQVVDTSKEREMMEKARSGGRLAG